MKTLLHKSIFLLPVILLTSVAASAQAKPENVFTPPEWILGEWVNHSGSETNKIERIAFFEHEIELVQNLADPTVKFSRKFQKYEVHETSEADTYRVVVSNSKEEMIWEFKFCPPEKCNLLTGDALSYSFTKNKKKLWDHSNSLNKVLVRRSRGA
jgi:hypothetical protein